MTLTASKGVTCCSESLILVGITWDLPLRFITNIIFLNGNYGMKLVDEQTMQEDAGKSIESELFAALLQTKLVRSREESNYHR